MYVIYKDHITEVIFNAQLKIHRTQWFSNIPQYRKSTKTLMNCHNLLQVVRATSANTTLRLNSIAAFI